MFLEVRTERRAEHDRGVLRKGWKQRKPRAGQSCQAREGESPVKARSVRGWLVPLSRPIACLCLTGLVVYAFPLLLALKLAYLNYTCYSKPLQIDVSSTTWLTWPTSECLNYTTFYLGASLPTTSLPGPHHEWVIPILLDPLGLKWMNSLGVSFKNQIYIFLLLDQLFNVARCSLDQEDKERVSELFTSQQLCWLLLYVFICIDRS